VSELEFRTLASYYDDAGRSRFIDKHMPDGTQVPIEYYQFSKFVERFPQNSDNGQWLAFGTTYEAPCRVSRGGRCTEYYDQAMAMSTHKYIIIKVTSGEHQGQYAMIDRANFSPTAGRICEVATISGVGC
jgi:hypothetical protein